MISSVSGGFVSIFEWLNLAAVFFTHLARTLGMWCGILNQTHVANSYIAFVQLFGFQENAFLTRKCSFLTSKTPLGRQGVRLLSSFWHTWGIGWVGVSSRTKFFLEEKYLYHRPLCGTNFESKFFRGKTNAGKTRIALGFTFLPGAG